MSKRHQKKAGPPKKYKEKFCADLLEHMGEGLSFACFAAKCGVTRATLYRWRDQYPEFKEAYEIGYCLSMLFWEKMGIAGTQGSIGFNTGSWCFNMKNRFGWKDKQETELTSTIKINIDKEDASL